MTRPASTLAERLALCTKLSVAEERTLIALCKFGGVRRASKELNLSHNTLTTQIRACRNRLQVTTALHACLIYQQYRLTSGHLLALLPANPITDPEGHPDE